MAAGSELSAAFSLFGGGDGSSSSEDDFVVESEAVAAAHAARAAILRSGGGDTRQPGQLLRPPARELDQIANARSAVLVARDADGDNASTACAVVWPDAPLVYCAPPSAMHLLAQLEGTRSAQYPAGVGGGRGFFAGAGVATVTGSTAPSRIPPGTLLVSERPFAQVVQPTEAAMAADSRTREATAGSIAAGSTVAPPPSDATWALRAASTLQAAVGGAQGAFVLAQLALLHPRSLRACVAEAGGERRLLGVASAHRATLREVAGSRGAGEAIGRWLASRAGAQGTAAGTAAAVEDDVAALAPLQLDDREREVLRLLMCMRYNCFSSGLFLHLSIFNHSSRPNCIKFSAGRGAAGAAGAGVEGSGGGGAPGGVDQPSEVWTTEWVEAGDELVIDYLSDVAFGVQTAARLTQQQQQQQQQQQHVEDAEKAKEAEKAEVSEVGTGGPMAATEEGTIEGLAGRRDAVLREQFGFGERLSKSAPPRQRDAAAPGAEWVRAFRLVEEQLCRLEEQASGLVETAAANQVTERALLELGAELAEARSNALALGAAPVWVGQSGGGGGGSTTMVVESDASAAAAVGAVAMAACGLLTEVLAPLLLCPPAGAGAAEEEEAAKTPAEFREDAAPGCAPLHVPFDAGQLDADARLEADMFHMVEGAGAGADRSRALRSGGSGGSDGSVPAKTTHAVALFAAACEARERWILKRMGPHHPEVSLVPALLARFPYALVLVSVAHSPVGVLTLAVQRARALMDLSNAVQWMLAHETVKKGKDAMELRATLSSWCESESAACWGRSFRSASIFENECRNECKRIDSLFTSEDFYS